MFNDITYTVPSKVKLVLKNLFLAASQLLYYWKRVPENFLYQRKLNSIYNLRFPYLATIAAKNQIGNHFYSVFKSTSFWC